MKDIAIIGGGLAGTACAHILRRAGLRFAAGLRLAGARLGPGLRRVFTTRGGVRLPELLMDCPARRFRCGQLSGKRHKCGP